MSAQALLIAAMTAEAAQEPARLSAVDRLVEQIRDFVRERNLVIGDPLPTERELGELFQAGRNTVREALQILKAYGIVEVRPKIGAVLSDRHEDAVRKLFAFQNEISPASFLDVQGFRRIIEVGICDHLILHATSADLDHLDEVNSRLLSPDSVEESARHDFAFHDALVALANNRTLLTNYRLLQPVITQIMRVGKADRPVQTDTHAAHAQIIKALRDRDRVAYTYLLSRHLEYGLQFVVTETGRGAPHS
jgi:GntR family transcriptional regulator, transcriptional repressor for pyruvate dehydrogenase complex